MQDWNRGRGGAEAYALWLREALRAAGDDVRLLTSSAGTAGDGTADYIAHGTEKSAAQTFLQIVNPFAVSTVRRAVTEFRPEVIWVNMFAHHLSAAAVFALGDAPKILAVSDYKVICPLGSKLLPDRSLCQAQSGWVCHRSGCLSLPHWLRDQPRYALIRSGTGRFHRVLACSGWVQRELAAAGIESEIIMLPVPAPSSHFERQPAPDPTILYCGRLDQTKGVDLLLRAFGRLSAEFPAAHLRIAGAGSERPDLERLAGSLGPANIEFLGWLNQQEIEHELSGAWASVVPSVWAEPQGLVALEAIVRQVPVIASSAGGLGEIVKNGESGLLFRNDDEQGLLDCLRGIVSGSAFPNHILEEEVVHGAAAEFSIERHTMRLRHVFSTAIQNHAAQ